MKEELKKQVSGLIINSIADTARNSLDNIILSTLFGLTVVAVYGNYYYVYSALYAIMLVINSVVSAGDSIASESIEKKYADLKKFTFIYAIISGWMIICMFCLYQPFMQLWVGRKLMLSDFNMMLICIYFYAINMNNSRNLYANDNGLW